MFNRQIVLAKFNENNVREEENVNKDKRKRKLTTLIAEKYSASIGGI